jgi:prepilin signal peptidase PulO-like enzyme (type II secretory pathway)
MIWSQKKFKFYSYLYPFIEFFLGIAYLIRWHSFYINLITFIIMIIGAIGVAIELSKKRTITCACLGLVFKIPMTYVTLIENVTMAAMALLMAIKNFTNL